MRKHLLTLFFALIAGFMPAIAQNNGKVSFDDYRKKVLGDYQDFRKGILDEYDKYLDGIWTEMQVLKERSRDPQPKPVKQPEVNPMQKPLPPAQQPAQLTLPEINDPAIKDPDVVVDIPQMNPMDIPQKNIPMEKIRQKHVKLSFYSMEPEFPVVDVSGFRQVCLERNYGNMWRAYAKAKLADKVVPYIQQYAKEYALNDWFVLELTRAWCDKVMADFPREGRISLAHYLLLHLGYNARIAVRGTDKPMLLLAFRQQVYGRRYVKIGGVQYYLFDDNVDVPPSDGKGMISTCELPKDAQLGAIMDLRIHKDLKIPYKAHPFEFTWNGFTLKGEMNENLIPMLYKYPQMPIGEYAASVVSTPVRTSLVEQVKAQLGGKPQLDAINTFLRFIQKGFAYESDDTHFGFEKPFFLEEMLYYPKCDCEDRSVFYTTLLFQALGVESHIVEFPGHASVAVALDKPIEGDNYVYENRKFYFSDPTYINSRTGMVIPAYRDKTADIVYEWKK